MSGTLAVFRRELRAYFYSPVAYAIIVMFLGVVGFFFYSSMAMYAAASYQIASLAQYMGEQELSIDDSVLRPLFGNIGVIFLFLLPLLTMRLFAEEKKNGSMELLFTWPLADSEIVVGKYLAAVSFFTTLLLLTTPLHATLGWFTPMPWGQVATGYLGLFLMGASFISLGLFFSSLTENQIIAAAFSFGSLLLLWVVGWSLGPQKGIFADTVRYISSIDHLDSFSKGVIDSRDLIYFTSFIALFLFLTLRSVESRRWRG